jgi:hypothetical protein
MYDKRKEYAVPTEMFQSEGDYQRWNAYRHAHGIKAPHLKKVCIKGKGCHAVKHGKKKTARKRVASKG